MVMALIVVKRKSHVLRSLISIFFVLVDNNQSILKILCSTICVTSMPNVCTMINSGHQFVCAIQVRKSHSYVNVKSLSQQPNLH